MWHAPTAHIVSDNLRLIIRNAPDGAEITVPPGEFEGPFIFDRPVRLVAHGDRPESTTLWTRRGPALIVRSAGVSLTNVNVELTLPEAHQDALLWYAAGCQPDTTGAQIQGRMEPMGKSYNSGGWDLPALIDLGDLRAKYPITLPMVVEVPGPAQLRGDLASMRIEPTRLLTGGKHMIQVGIPGERLFKDTMLAGQLIIESGGDSRTIWIIGRVLEDEFKAWVCDKIILVSQSGRKYGFDSGMLLGKEQLRGEAGVNRIDEKQAYILKEPSGIWSLIQPLPVNLPTLVNGRPVGVGQRQLLKGGEIIEIGDIKLTVETKKTQLPLTVGGQVDFGKLSTRSMASPPTIQVKNNSRFKKWEGTLRATVPWLEIPQPQVVCPGGKAVQVAVQLGSGLDGLPRQMINYTGALMLEGGNETWAISAQLDVDIEEGLQVEPTTLDFGQVSIPNAIKPQQLRLRNTGNAHWQGSIQLLVPWLVVNPINLQCAAGQETIVEVRITDPITSLPEGPNMIAEALKIEGQGLMVPVPVRLHFNRPKVQLDVKPRSLDWGQVMDWRAAKPQTIYLYNSGNKDWQGQAESKIPWLEVKPTTLRCPAQGQATLTACLTEQFQGLAVGEQKTPAAIRIEGEGLTFSVLTQLVVEAPQIQPDTTLINLTLDDRTDLPHYALRLQNRGGQDWHGTVKSTLRWLGVSPTDVTCPANSEVVIDVSLGSQVSVFKRSRTVKVADAIRIESGGAPLLIGVCLEIKAPIAARPDLSIKRPSPAKGEPKSIKKKPPPVTPPPEPLVIDFGRVSDWSGVLPSQEIRLTNSQSHPMEGTVRSTLPWLEVTPASFSCPGGQQVVLTARLTKQAAGLRPKSYSVADALVIESGGKKRLVKAQLEVIKVSPSGQISLPNTPPKSTKKKPPLVTPPPEPLVIDFGRVSDWSGVLPSQEIRLTNGQSHPMEGTVRSTLPWLEVTPASFSCPVGQQVVLTARLTKQAAGLRPKSYSVADALVIESGGKKRLVKAQLEVEASARSLTMRTILPPREERGTGSAHSGKDHQPKKVKSNKDGQAPPALPESLVVEPASIDMGTVSNWSGPFPAQEIKLSNGLKADWRGTVHSTVPWLKVESEEITCATGATISLKISLTSHGARLRSRTYLAPDALVIEGEGQKLEIEARLTVS
ncbi:MAG: hypothetical protein H6631_12275 [Anaerolineaceae bacterium]|nr:hypothetical protein [Anaerolineaceae bacterium]MCB9098586.1 hypothetical protein [Anaerolineales bacterium]